MNDEHHAILEEIHDAISSGTLSRDIIESRLTNAIEEECLQQDHLTDAEFLNACLDLLAELKTDGQFSFEQKADQTKASVMGKYEAHIRLREASRRIVKMLVCVVLVLLAGLAGSLLSRRTWFSASSTPDEQQYVIEGQSLQTAAVGHADSMRNLHADTLITERLDEAVAELGFQPPMANPLPDGWSVKRYTVMKAHHSDRFVALYVDSDISTCLYEVQRYDSIKEAQLYFEQDRQGEIVTTNHANVYYTENLEHKLYMWIDGHTIYSVYGDASNEKIWELVQAILEGAD